jgi:hypothetical protein
MREVLLGRKITAARGADPGIGDPDRSSPVGPVERLSVFLSYRSRVSIHNTRIAAAQGPHERVVVGDPPSSAPLTRWAARPPTRRVRGEEIMGATKWSTAFGAAGLALVAVTANAAAQGQPPHVRGAGRAVLTNADSGRTVAVGVGGDIEVRLTHYRDRAVTYVWDAPETGDRVVLRRTSDTTTPSGNATAVFHATAGGVATISAQLRCVPDLGSVCPLIVVPWKVTIEVK